MTAHTKHICSLFRYHLDKVNLPVMTKPFKKNRASNVSDIIWNISLAFCDKVDNITNAVIDFHNAATGGRSILSEPQIEAVDTLRILRHICREITLCFYRRPCYSLDASSWRRMVNDIDRFLHEFQHRHFLNPPPFSSKREGTKTPQDNDRGGPLKENTKQEKIQQSPALFELDYEKLDDLQPYEKGLTISDRTALVRGDEISLKLHGKRFSGRIESVANQMETFLIRYETLAEFHKEYLPKNSLRKALQGSGDSGTKHIR